MNYWAGNKITLRAIEPSDWEFFFRWNMNSELGRNLDFLWPPQSQESIKVWAFEKSKKKLENDAFFWVIENNQRVAVGSFDTYNCDHRNGNFSYAVGIIPEHQRKGYASEAIRLVLGYYFQGLRYQKVNARVHSNNLASISLHEKLGFKKEGTIRQAIFSEGQYYDEIWYGMIKEEFMDINRY